MSILHIDPLDVLVTAIKFGDRLPADRDLPELLRVDVRGMPSAHTASIGRPTGELVVIVVRGGELRRRAIRHALDEVAPADLEPVGGMSVDALIGMRGTATARNFVPDFTDARVIPNVACSEGAVRAAMLDAAGEVLADVDQADRDGVLAELADMKIVGRWID